MSHDTEILHVCGMDVKVTYDFDDSITTPWDDSDCHGPVSKWTTRSKHPGERVLMKDRNSALYYDWQAACRMARKEWGVKKGGVEAVVQSDFDYLKAWCRGDWCYVGVTVKCGAHEDSIWGVETYNDYHKEYAKGMAQTLVQWIKDEDAEVAYWNARDVATTR